MKIYKCDCCGHLITSGGKLAETVWIPGLAGVVTNSLDLCRDCKERALDTDWREVVIKTIIFGGDR